jgi:hypothetical protein
MPLWFTHLKIAVRLKALTYLVLQAQPGNPELRSSASSADKGKASGFAIAMRCQGTGLWHLKLFGKTFRELGSSAVAGQRLPLPFVPPPGSFGGKEHGVQDT